MKKKQTIKLNESQLQQVIKESVKKVLNEVGDTHFGQYALGALYDRKKESGDADKAWDVAKYARNKMHVNDRWGNDWDEENVDSFLGGADDYRLNRDKNGNKQFNLKQSYLSRYPNPEFYKDYKGDGPIEDYGGYDDEWDDD